MSRSKAQLSDNRVGTDSANATKFQQPYRLPQTPTVLTLPIAPDAHRINGTERATRERLFGLRRIANNDFPEPVYSCHKGLKTL